MLKVFPKVIANLLLLVLAAISIKITVDGVRYTSKPWPEMTPQVESTGGSWVCIGNSFSQYQVPANQLHSDRKDDSPVKIVTSRSYFSWKEWRQAVFFLTAEGELVRVERGGFELVFRLATYVLGWVGLIRFFVMIPRWYRSWARG